MWQRWKEVESRYPLRIPYRHGVDADILQPLFVGQNERYHLQVGFTVVEDDLEEPFRHAYLVLPAYISIHPVLQHRPRTDEQLTVLGGPIGAPGLQCRPSRRR